jgi:hypothetical protein
MWTSECPSVEEFGYIVDLLDDARGDSLSDATALVLSRAREYNWTRALIIASVDALLHADPELADRHSYQHVPVRGALTALWSQALVQIWPRAVVLGALECVIYNPGEPIVRLENMLPRIEDYQILQGFLDSVFLDGAVG